MTNQAHRIDKKIIQALSKRSVFPWLWDAFMDWAVIIGSTLFVYWIPNPLCFFLALFIIGNRQHALVILGHDGTHCTLSLNKKFNDTITNFLCFWPLGLTVSGYRALHWQHHRHTGTDKDPEVKHKKSRNPQWDLPMHPLTILKYAFLDSIGFSIPDYKIIITYSKPDKSSEYIPLIIWHVLFFSCLIIAGLWLFALLWYASLLTTFMMWFRLRLFLEHQGTSDTHRLYLNPIEGALFAPHYSWMHWEHHNWPSIPYHRLSKIRELVTDVPVMNLQDLVNLLKFSEPLSSGKTYNK
jgi:fatty acid desaturase